jgi:5'-nucleotidase
VADRVLGRARTTLENAPDELGRLVADAERRYAHADIAIVNPGSIRDDLPAGPITYGDLFDVHAYEHRLVRMKMRGAELDGLPEQRYVSGVRSPLDPGRTYTVVANELIADSDGFGVLRRGRARRVLGTDLEALVAEVKRLRVVG